ncbi:CapA family protein [Kamptonema formosum]|uniref:CapA family protein n=1 Tax=Kamptonema formosum TaxID=331992 RepID=UPI000478026F|nr:CapA family protein [Oscillatoria sp. PCC 10802]
MDQQDMEALAKGGDPDAIAFALNLGLRSKGVTATALRKDRCLHILLDSASVPAQQACVDYIRDELLRLGVTSIPTVKVCGRQTDQPLPAWTEAFELRASILAKLRSIWAQPQKKPLTDSNQPPNPGKTNAKWLFLCVGTASFVLGTGTVSVRISQQYSRFAPISSLTQSPAEQPAVFETPSIQPAPPARPLSGEALGEMVSAHFSPPLPFSKNPDGQASELPPNKERSAHLAGSFMNASAAVAPSAAATSITIKAVGDIIPGSNYPYSKLPKNERVLFQSVKAHLQGADLLFGNFESTLTNYPYSAKNTSTGRSFAFRTPPKYAQLLKSVGFDVFNVANNHSGDFFERGFEDTFNNIEKAGMKAVGKKGQILYMTVKGVPVAFIGFSNYDFHNSILDLPAAKKLVAEARKNAKIVVISVHAGAEGTGAMRVRNQQESFYGENRGNMVLFSRTVIDAGADLILGHGPHVPRAVELYKGKLIAYSLGNFLGYRSLSTVAELGYSLILQVELNAEGDFVSGKIVPVHLDGEGIPYIDQSFRSVKLIRNLTQSDFPKTALRIERNGKIVKKTEAR